MDKQTKREEIFLAIAALVAFVLFMSIDTKVGDAKIKEMLGRTPPVQAGR